MDAIVVTALGKTYGGRGLPMRRSEEVRALHDLSISVHEGEMIKALAADQGISIGRLIKDLLLPAARQHHLDAIARGERAIGWGRTLEAAENQRLPRLVHDTEDPKP